MLFKVSSSNASPITVSDRNKSFPAQTIAALASAQSISLPPDQGDEFLIALERLSGSGVTYTIEDDPAVADAVENRPLKRTLTLLETAFAGNAVNGAASIVNVGAALPANARILGYDFRALTPFTGGGAASVTGKLGTAGDDDALVAAVDLLTAAVDGGPATITRGVRPNKHFAAAGAQLILTVTPDGGANLAALTAGSVIVDVWYQVG